MDNALEQMTNGEIENIIQHERVEIQTGKLLGSDWGGLLFSLPHSKPSLYLRALRDHPADHLTTLPSLTKNINAPSIHFYFGNLTNLREEPSSKFLQAYDENK